MKHLSFLSIAAFILFPMLLTAQGFVKYKTVSYSNIYLRDSTHVLARIDANIPSPGKVLVHFDGEAYPDVGDRIIVAANNEAGWSVNDGNVGIESSNAEVGKSFSHSRGYAYSLTETGMKSFYAVAQNYAGKDGSGIGSVYGTLTVEFFPDNGLSTIAVGSIQFNGDITNTTVLSQQTITALSAGKMIVRSDGEIYSDFGDLDVLAASNTTSWLPNDGNVSVEAGPSGYHLNSFSHTREYNVSASGDYTYYALAQNYGETDGNGTAGIYANMEVEFYPNSGQTLVAFQGFSKPSLDLNDHFVQLTSVSINAPGPGLVMVDLDGDMTSDPGDRIELGASDQMTLQVNDGNVTLEAIDTDLNRNCFVHTRVYTVNAGQHTFYALGRTDSSTPGSGIANIYGELMVKYFPDVNTAVSEVTDVKNEFDVYPDPTQDKINITFKEGIPYDRQVRLFDMNGHELRVNLQSESDDVRMDLSSLAPGIYFVRIGDGVKKVMKM